MDEARRLVEVGAPLLMQLAEQFQLVVAEVLVQGEAMLRCRSSWPAALQLADQLHTGELLRSMASHDFFPSLLTTFSLVSGKRSARCALTCANITPAFWHQAASFRSDIRRNSSSGTSRAVDEARLVEPFFDCLPEYLLA
jgi:hypothetical protein